MKSRCTLAIGIHLVEPGSYCAFCSPPRRGNFICIASPNVRRWSGANRFVELLTAWVLCPGRRTGTRLWQMVAGADRPRYEAYMAFCREGRWPKWSDLLGVWARLLVNHLSARHLPGVRELWLLPSCAIYCVSDLKRGSSIVRQLGIYSRRNCVR